MTVTPNDVIPLSGLNLSDDLFSTAVNTALKLTPHIVDRPDLHGRDVMERFYNVLNGEIAEQAVIAYLHRQGKFAESAVDKNAARPDLGHDIHVRRLDGTQATCSIKSSLSYKFGVEGILRNFRPAFKPSELREFNIQVYYHYTLDQPPRLTLPAFSGADIIGWGSLEDLSPSSATAYTGEQRKVVDIKLAQMSPMASLLPLLS